MVRTADLSLDVWKVLYSYEAWRVVTSLFYAGKHLEFVIGLVMLYRLSSSLERYHYPGRTIDYAWQVLTDATWIIGINCLFFSSEFHFHAFILSLVTVSAKIEPKAYVSFFGLFTLRNQNFPYLLLLIEHFINGSYYTATTGAGFVIGWLWWLFVHNETEKRRGTNFGAAPKWFRRLLGGGKTVIRNGRIVRSDTPMARRTTPTGREAVKDISGAHAWGSGFELGKPQVE